MATAPTTNLSLGSSPGLLSAASQQLLSQTGPAGSPFGKAIPNPAPTTTATGPAPRPGAGTATPAPGGVAVQPTPSLTSLYAQNPGAGTFAPSNTGTATPVGAAPTASASNVGPLAAINSNGTINPNDSTNAASQLDAITKANSPYIQQATHQGLLTAASRGLENSSLGAGAAEAAAVAAAAPFAQQNAQAATGGLMQNSQLQTQAGEFNASQANANQQLESQLKTQQTQFNASQEQQAAATNAAAKNAMTQQTMQLNEQINQQYLSGSQSQTLASIQGQFNQLIQTNASASGLYNSMMTQIGAMMNNKDLAPQRIADSISALQSRLAAGLSVIDAINGGSTASNPLLTPTPIGTTRPTTAPAAPGAAPAPTAPQRTTQPVTMYNNPLGLG